MIDDVVAHLRRGEVVGVPTDTVYGLAVDPHNESAVQRLFEIKGRPARKPVSLLVDSVGEAGRIIVMSDAASELAALHWPGALTLVGVPRGSFPDWIGDPETRSVGVRVPNHPELLSILAATGALAVTSANLSDLPDTLDDGAAREVFGDAVSFYVPGSCGGGTASTVVDVTRSDLRVLRPGPIDL